MESVFLSCQSSQAQSPWFRSFSSRKPSWSCRSHTGRNVGCISEPFFLFQSPRVQSSCRFRCCSVRGWWKGTSSRRRIGFLELFDARWESETDHGRHLLCALHVLQPCRLPNNTNMQVSDRYDILQICYIIDMIYCRYDILQIWYITDMIHYRYDIIQILYITDTIYYRYDILQIWYGILHIWYNTDMIYCRYDILQIWYITDMIYYRYDILQIWYITDMIRYITYMIY